MRQSVYYLESIFLLMQIFLKDMNSFAVRTINNEVQDFKVSKNRIKHDRIDDQNNIRIKDANEVHVSSL